LCTGTSIGTPHDPPFFGGQYLKMVLTEKCNKFQMQETKLITIIATDVSKQVFENLVVM
jgi:hypothetical protein